MASPEDAPTAQCGIHIAHDKMPHGQFTGPLTQMLKHVSANGIPVLDFGPEENLDPTKGLFTILIGKSNDEQIGKALKAIRMVHIVTQAELRDLCAITKELHARIQKLSDEERKTMRKDFGMKIQRTAIFPNAGKRDSLTIMKNLAGAGANLEKRGSNPLKLRIRKPNEAVDALVTSFGGAYRDTDVLHLAAPVLIVEEAARYIRSPAISPRVTDFNLSGLRSSLHPSLINKKQG